MAINLAAIFANVLISQLVGSVLQNFSTRCGANERTLDSFLNILSTDFVNRVENVVRDAFQNQNFLEVKADLRSGATAFRTFIATEGNDESQLTLTCEKVISARSRILVMVEETLALNPARFMNKSSDEKGALVKQHNKVLEAAMVSLQAIAALDLLVLARKANDYPGISAEIVSRIDEYKDLAKKLKDAYLNHQSFRKWIQWNHTIARDTCSTDRHCTFEYSLYLDGERQDHKVERLFHLHPDSVENEKRKFEKPFIYKCGTDFTLYREAQTRLASEGNLNQAIEAWNAVRGHYSG